jgi:LysR family transcriptional regulator, glycine cleavage system transcriptional activator
VAPGCVELDRDQSLETQSKVVDDAAQKGREIMTMLRPKAALDFIAHFITPSNFLNRPISSASPENGEENLLRPTKGSTGVISRAYYPVMRHLPPLTAVKVFEAAARHENFTQAAAELRMTQAAVSYQVRLLEERLGVPLFLRSKQRVTLSDAGRRVAPHVSTALDGISEAFASLIDENETVLSISTAQTFAANWLAPRLGIFHIERPELAVRLQTTNVLVDFARDDVDVAVRMGSGGWPGLRQHFLFRHHWTPLCSPGFRDRYGLGVPQDVLRAPRLSPDDDWWKQWLSAAGVVEPDGVRAPGIRLDSQVEEGQAVLAGHGIAMLTPLFWKTELASGRLVQPFPLITSEARGSWLVYPEHKRNQPKIKAFRDWMMRQIAVEAAAGPAEAFEEPAAA